MHNNRMKAISFFVCDVSIQASLKIGIGDIEQLCETFLEHFKVLLNQVGSVIVGLLDDKDQGQISLHRLEHEYLVLVFELHLDLRLAFGLVLFLVPPVQETNVDENVQHLRAYLIPHRVDRLLVVVSDVQLCYQVIQVNLLQFAHVRYLVQQLADGLGA